MQSKRISFVIVNHTKIITRFYLCAHFINYDASSFSGICREAWPHHWLNLVLAGLQFSKLSFFNSWACFHGSLIVYRKISIMFSKASLISLVYLIIKKLTPINKGRRSVLFTSLSFVPYMLFVLFGMHSPLKMSIVEYI